MENLINRITINPDVCNGKPVIRGMRITVSTVLEFLAGGETTENILEAYPALEPDDILACFEYAKSMTDKSFLSHDLQAS